MDKKSESLLWSCGDVQHFAWNTFFHWGWDIFQYIKTISKKYNVEQQSNLKIKTDIKYELYLYKITIHFILRLLIIFDFIGLYKELDADTVVHRLIFYFYLFFVLIVLWPLFIPSAISWWVYLHFSVSLDCNQPKQKEPGIEGPLPFFILLITK